MSKNNETKNPNQLKVFNSPIYRRKIKQMVQMVKTVYGIHHKIPKGSLPKVKGNATEREKTARAEKENYRLTIDTLHYFAAPLHGSFASSKQETTNNEQSEQTAG